MNQPIIVNKDTYRVIIEISDCIWKNNTRYWLVEKDSSILKLGEIHNTCKKN